MLRFIHIFRYLSELRSFKAAYHSPEDVCFREIARRLPPSPVTALACFRQAAFRSDIVLSSSGGSSANDPIPMSAEVFDRVGFEGASFKGGILGEVFGDEDFEDEVLEDDDFVDEPFGDDALADADFEDFSLEDVVFDDDGVFGATVFEDGVDGVFGVFGTETFGDADFEGVVGDGAVFVDGPFEGANFVVTIFEGTTFGATTGVGSTGPCEGWNWPLAICRARSFTLRNILTARWGWRWSGRNAE